ncbi:MAG: phage GP46 family protein [Bdellovibrionota bacterium]
MSDLLFDFFENDMALDLVVNNSEVQVDESLKSAVLVSLFTDVRCEKTELPSGETLQRGYFGDGIFGEKTGSKLWLLERAKYTNDVLIKAKEYAQNALNWLVTDGLAKEVGVQTYFNEKKKMILNITLFKNNDAVESITINNLWSSV